MAQLDQIILKHSTQSEEDFVKSINGTNPAEARPQKIEPGELVLRRDAGFFELWALDSADETVRVRAEALVPPWDPEEELKDASLGQLGDVDLKSGLQPGQELSPADAGKLLTWDGAMWVARVAPGFENGVLGTLNDVGDVNYAYWSQQGADKYQPDSEDVLQWLYNPYTVKYEWAPVPFSFESMSNVTKRSTEIVLNKTIYKSFTFGNELTTTTDSASFGFDTSGAFIKNSWTVFNGSTQVPLYTRLELKKDGNAYFDLQKDGTVWIKAQGGLADKVGGIAIDPDDIPESLPGESYLTTLFHVRQDWLQHDLGEVRDVNLTGLTSGMVLTWDAINSQWVANYGPAPDLTAASVNELFDVDTIDKGAGKSLVWDATVNRWTAQNVEQFDITPDYNDLFRGTDNSTHTRTNNICRECTQEIAGAIAIVENHPYICLNNRTTSTLAGNDPDQWAWVRFLLDGYNSPVTDAGSGYPPEQNRQAIPGRIKTDPLAPVAYEGSLGSLNNVSTANVFPGGAVIYDSTTLSFKVGFPALDLSSYSINLLSDVFIENASVGYGLLWDGEQWVSSSLEQKVRLDDMQDVQFGQLGVVNNKLVAAYPLVDGDATNYLAKTDVSSVLSVSVQKGDASFGTTQQLSFSPDGYLYNKSRLFDIPPGNPTLAEKLDAYVRWGLDNSWQEIDGDGCIEIHFLPILLLDSRTIFRKVSSVSALGGYRLVLEQTGGLTFSCTAPTGYVGFTLSTPNNSVSLDNWHHVAVTREAGVNRLYLDGQLMDTATSFAPWTGNGQFLLGRNDLDDNNTLTHWFFKGWMFDLRVTKGRAKYTGTSYTIPGSLEAEIIDTTPQSGDFLSYDGTKWTNVSGVDADISNNSISELSDVDTTTQNPVTGDALVWTGNGWEPGIPGVGAAWSLDDFTDVQTFYQASIPSLIFNQAERIYLSNAFQTVGDSSFMGHDRDTGTYIAYYDDTFTCDSGTPGHDGPFIDSQSTYVEVTKLGNIQQRSVRNIIDNVFYVCGFLVPLEAHEPVLHYRKCPDRDYEGPSRGGDIFPGSPESTFVPCWGVIQDHMYDLLPSGQLGMLGNVSSTPATNGQALVWDSTLGEWKPSSTVAADISNNTIDDLVDVNTGGKGPGEVLTWDGAKWIATSKLEDLFDISNVNAQLLTNSNQFPVRLADMPGVNANGQDTTVSPDFPDANKIIDFYGTGMRGIAFSAPGTAVGFGSNVSWLFGARSTYGATILTSPGSAIGNDAKQTWLELGYRTIRISDGGDTFCGADGFRLAEGWRVVYEDSTTTFAAYTADSVPHKGAIQTYVETGLANLDLSPNSIDDLGDVDTSNLQNGQALAWDAVALQWKPSSGVAADLSLSSIGDLSDITLTANSAPNVNDGRLSFEVSEFKTSRPSKLNGGIELLNEDESGYIGWSNLVAHQGAPVISHDSTYLRVESDRIFVDSVKGIVYQQEPSLGDFTAPCWQQVKQQIARQATDYTALFFLDGNSFSERNYNWTVTASVATSPNPVYFSKFPGEYSYEFRKVSQDRITWTESDGMPLSWNAENLASFEFWVYASSTDPGDGDLEYLMAPAGDGSSNASNGIHVGLRGDDRSILWCNIGDNSNTQDQIGSNAFETPLNLDDWNHFVLQNEGSGRWRGYLNGNLFLEKIYNAEIQFVGGISFGGRQNTVAANAAGYFTGFIDDIRITRSWIPYTPNNPTIPAPVVPLEGQGWREAYGLISELADVDTISSPPSNGQVLTWDNINKLWIPASGVAYDVSANSITDLSDVNTNNATASQDDILHWNNVSQKWERTKIDGNGGIRALVARSATPGAQPAAGNLYAGELYLNMADRVLYSLDSGGQPFKFASDFERVIGGTF